MKQEDYDRIYNYNRERSDGWIKKKIKNYGAVLTKNGFKKAIIRRLPPLRWLAKYKLNMLLPDLVAGLTMGIYNVPQAMSYSTLAGLPPVYGLYASFFPPLFYAMFGSAKHTSIGVFSITCLMVNKCIESVMKYKTDHPDEYIGLTRVQIVTSLCMLTGIIQTFMAVIRCDKLMKFLGAPAISAITFSACFFGIVSQIPKLGGFSVPSRNEHWFSLFHSILDILENVDKSNTATICISLCSLAFLITSKILIDPLFQKHKTLRKIKIPFPKELITIVVATAFSYAFNFEKTFGVKTLHTVPKGFPLPELPKPYIWPHIVKDAFSIGIVAYAVAMAMGQKFADEHKYIIDSNQELLALGLINIGSSFFSVFPTSASLSRTLVNERSGAITQLSGVTSAVFIGFVITIIGPFLASLPNCVLAAIVVVVLESMVRQCTELPNLWRCSKHDFWIWVITAGVTLCSDIAEGVAAGIFFAILTIAIQSQQPTIKLLGQVRKNDFRPINHYGSAKETEFRIIRFDAPLIFANVEKFLNNVRDSTMHITKKRNESCESQETAEWSAIILDCHTWIYTDSMGIGAVRKINEDLQKDCVVLLFANLKSSLRRQYKSAGIVGESKLEYKEKNGERNLVKTIIKIGSDQIYPSIQDAMDSALEVIQTKKMFFSVKKSEPEEKNMLEKKIITET